MMSPFSLTFWKRSWSTVRMRDWTTGMSWRMTFLTSWGPVHQNCPMESPCLQTYSHFPPMKVNQWLQGLNGNLTRAWATSRKFSMLEAENRGEKKDLVINVNLMIRFYCFLHSFAWFPKWIRFSTWYQLVQTSLDMHDGNTHIMNTIFWKLLLPHE